MVEESKEVVVAQVATPEEAEIKDSVTSVERMASEITIKSDEDLQNAVDFVKTIKESAGKVTEFFKPMKDSAYKAHKSVCDREKSMLKPLQTAEKEVKEKIGCWTREQERIRAEREAEMRRMAEAESARKLEEAARLEAEGKKEEAEAALQDAQYTEDAAKNMTVMAASPKADGLSAQKAWEIVDVDSSKVPVEINGIEIRPVDTSAVMKIIKMSKGKVTIPGIAYRETTQVSVRR